MDEMICYLNKHIEIQRVVFLVGDTYEYSRLNTFLEKISIKKLILVGNLCENDANEIKKYYDEDKSHDKYPSMESFEYSDISDFSGLDGDWALCAEWCSAHALAKAAIWAPKYLLATIWQEHTTAFKIWELYKEATVFIQIKTLRWNKEPQLLEWSNNKKNNIELSIIFPMYNVAKYLDECIASVIEWKAPYVEFLFINDGSPDNSREIVLKWAEKDSRVKLLDKPNGGCASARQFGLDKANGTYIGFVDPDDFIDESMFRKLFRAAITGSYEISYCGYNEYYENTKGIKRVEDALGWPYCDGTTDPTKIWDLIAYCRVAIWRGIYKADMLKRNNIHFYTDLRRFDDLPFKIETFAVAKSVIALPEHLYYYRLARPGQDVSADDERLYVHFDIFNYLNESIGSTKNARLIDLLQISKIQTHLYALKKIRPEFQKVYVRQAKKDLETTGEKERTYNLANKKIGTINADYYKAIVEEDFDKLNQL